MYILKLYCYILDTLFFTLAAKQDLNKAIELCDGGPNRLERRRQHIGSKAYVQRALIRHFEGDKDGARVCEFCTSLCQYLKLFNLKFWIIVNFFIKFRLIIFFPRWTTKKRRGWGRRSRRRNSSPWIRTRPCATKCWRRWWRKCNAARRRMRNRVRRRRPTE